MTDFISHSTLIPGRTDAILRGPSSVIFIEALTLGKSMDFKNPKRLIRALEDRVERGVAGEGDMVRVQAEDSRVYVYVSYFGALALLDGRHYRKQEQATWENAVYRAFDDVRESLRLLHPHAIFNCEAVELSNDERALTYPERVASFERAILTSNAGGTPSDAPAVSGNMPERNEAQIVAQPASTPEITATPISLPASPAVAALLEPAVKDPDFISVKATPRQVPQVPMTSTLPARVQLAVDYISECRDAGLLSPRESLVAKGKVVEYTLGLSFLPASLKSDAVEESTAIVPAQSTAIEVRSSNGIPKLEDRKFGSFVPKNHGLISIHEFCEQIGYSAVGVTGRLRHHGWLTDERYVIQTPIYGIKGILNYQSWLTPLAVEQLKQDPEIISWLGESGMAHRSELAEG